MAASESMKNSILRGKGMIYSGMKPDNKSSTSEAQQLVIVTEIVQSYGRIGHITADTDEQRVVGCIPTNPVAFLTPSYCSLQPEVQHPVETTQQRLLSWKISCTT
ncbi:hypothetical protein TNCV_1062311 [Trichonephila clavipes]|nr:hypothetical protein TNCV_1062311 [Trichonephila clavipes]